MSNIKLKSLVREFGEKCFTADDKVLFCKICEAKVSHQKRFSIQQHLGTKKHKDNLQKPSTSKTDLICN